MTVRIRVATAADIEAWSAMRAELWPEADPDELRAEALAWDATAGRALIAAVEAWTREQGCTELASDALIDNAASHAAHAACGFEETERVVYFRKPLQA